MTIPAEHDTLLRQAPMAAQSYMLACDAYIDEHFGEGFAEKHTHLLAAMIIASAVGHGCYAISKEVGEALDALQP
jgi:hypothetical protein